MIRLFGNSPVLRVLDFFLTFREFDYPLTEIAENAGIGWSTLHKIFPKLIEMDVIKPTREIGRAKLYKLNLETPIVQALIQFDEKLCSEFAARVVIRDTRSRVKQNLAY